ncbi:hypothetical protein AVEN_139966-1 [Araneus ventricosus]|uniref:Lipase domain-containing protein n=1 Tax=Araneus ventricosus TaxID=182803 RepID=A0A4Y2X2W9_ARAVE|nr:hypothetical protein AVEN_71292-1 [Araneus ventricosus]GBO42447.1 hypothetical protein AVEN_116817-1 [Araneus ventricosus]GBO42450.1 hypothetical protein AVEN_124658-1 [Araneus ventricosus]GBO42451.1 hypothetical protein AVEN_139966-1 [Araneus ventricosus]
MTTCYLLLYLFISHVKPRWPDGKASVPGWFLGQNWILLQIRRGLVNLKSEVEGATFMLWCGAEAWRGGHRPRCRPGHLNFVLNHEIRPDYQNLPSLITKNYFQNGS